MKNTQSVSLDHLGILKITGADSRKFLQGQVTCDTQKICDHNLTHGAHCTPKGRMIANFDAFAHNGDTLLLRAPADVLPELLASLKKYIVFSRAEIEDVSDSYRLIGVQGGSLEKICGQLGFSQSCEGQSVMAENIIYHCLDDLRLECWVPVTDAVPKVIDQLPWSKSFDNWQARDIEMGKGWVRKETVEAFLPQMLNLQTEAIGGISFTKGCYTGQEIVARMHYKGKLKRQMFRFRTSAPVALEPGTNLYQPNQTQAAGQVVNSVLINGYCELLAVATTELLSNTNTVLQTENSEKLERINLPYAITTES